MHVLGKHGAHVTSTTVYDTRVCCHSCGESQSRPMEVQVGPALLRDEKNMYNISSDPHYPHQRLFATENNTVSHSTRETCRRNELIRETFEFVSVSRGILQGWNYHVHTYMEQRSARSPLAGSLCRFSSGISRDLRPGGEGGGGASGLHRYGLRVIPCKPREPFFLRFFCAGFHLAGKARTGWILSGNHRSVSFYRGRGTRGSRSFEDRSSRRD